MMMMGKINKNMTIDLFRRLFDDVHGDGWILFIFNYLSCFYPFYFLIMKNKIERLGKDVPLKLQFIFSDRKRPTEKNNKNSQDVKLKDDK
jgi:hypothetical protein